jgi:hypothetical protein
MSTATNISNVKRSFTATTTVDAYRVVQLLANGTVSASTLTDADTKIGLTERKANAGDVVPIVLQNGGGTAFGEIVTTITTGNALYVASGGTLGVTTVSAGAQFATALQNGVAGDVIEILLA